MSSSVPPSSISILAANTSADANTSLTVTENKEETVKCLTKHSNPPPSISWILGETILKATNQTNTLDEESNKWTSEATLVHIFQKSDLGKTLTCVVSHMAYTTGQEIIQATLDILCGYKTCGYCW